MISNLERDIYAANCGHCCRIQCHLRPGIPWLRGLRALNLRTVLLAYDQYAFAYISKKDMLADFDAREHDQRHARAGNRNLI